MKTLHVKVTEEDIRSGIRKSSISCPIALAVRRVVEKTKYVEVSHASIFLYPVGGGSYIAVLPPDVSGKVAAFDGGANMLPFEFDVEPVKVSPMGEDDD